VTSPEGYLLALWVHECRRVFADKLVNYDDKGWVDKAMSDLCRQEFPPDLCKQVRPSFATEAWMVGHNFIQPPSTTWKVSAALCHI
jgi:hypothetical protein